VPILEPAEGDLIAAMLRRRITAPLAGYDPQLQLLSLSDAAECLICALLSDVPGIINGAPRGTVPVKAALRAAGPLRIPVNGVVQKPVRSWLWKVGVARQPGEAMDRIKYNWTVSAERAIRETGFNPKLTSAQALKQYLRRNNRGKPERIKDEYDEFGLDPEYLARMGWWFKFLVKAYWRAEVQGLENIPAAGTALLVANHRGFMPFDGVVHRASILETRKRHIRFLVIPSLFKFPFLSDFLVKQGGVVASQANTQKLFARNELVGIFPEGINGAFRMYKGAYRLGDMSRNAFARMAIENGVSIIPSATIGHVEIFPILAKVRSSLVVRHTGWPFLPITPTFPFLPFPLPTKWHIRYLEPIPVNQYSPGDAAEPAAVNELAAKVCSVMQRNIDEMLGKRKHIFFGDIFGPRADAAPRSPAGAHP
jgi:1-acyl-sn-glycerol-3-phosphate acyltransferase